MSSVLCGATKRSEEGFTQDRPFALTSFTTCNRITVWDLFDVYPQAGAGFLPPQPTEDSFLPTGCPC